MSWTDRVVEYPNRVKLTAVSGQDNTFNMEAAEGTVYVEGTLLNAENLNNETMNLIGNVVSDAWSESRSYNVGDSCIYNNMLWNCLTANTNILPTEGAYWTRILLGNYARKWRFVGTSTGLYDAHAINLPTDDYWDEVFVKVYMPTNKRYSLTISLPRLSLTEAGADGFAIMEGGYINANDNHEIIVNASKTKITLQAYYFAGTNNGANARFDVYVR